jgi:hypothetical protein
MGESKSTGWSKAAQRRAAVRYGRGRSISQAAPEDRGQEHEAETDARTERKGNGS